MVLVTPATYMVISRAIILQEDLHAASHIVTL